ncbi:hypothetical protein [Mucilaginibacter sp.]|uniref:hypothetical protein n=1 Tax=Mucilaginibacter sp. TaxID=1882438 RepID=UPI00261E5F9B|nr:hypothetical protein [Mucilaginibacter sp.]MDB5030424.1 hypothetical protein [Mucilaginibacter sp.]
MALKVKPDMPLSTRTNLTANNIKEAMAEFTGVKIIEALEIILKDLPPQQKAQLMANVDEVIDLVL